MSIPPILSSSPEQPAFFNAQAVKVGLAISVALFAIAISLGCVPATPSFVPGLLTFTGTLIFGVSASQAISCYKGLSDNKKWGLALLSGLVSICAGSCLLGLTRGVGYNAGRVLSSVGFTLFAAGTIGLFYAYVNKRAQAASTTPNRQSESSRTPVQPLSIQETERVRQRRLQHFARSEQQGQTPAVAPTRSSFCNIL
jgi:hypothetical protein